VTKPYVARPHQEDLYALTEHEPWGTLIAYGAKKIETRSWRAPKWLKRFCIHCGKHWDEQMCSNEFVARALCQPPEDRARFVRGGLVAVVELIECIPTDDRKIRLELRRLGNREKHFGNYAPGRWAWRLQVILLISPPIMCRGRQRLWKVQPEIAAVINSELRRIAA
jgi:hypothetical protein